ncbi:MAG: ExbD/TolR family protein [Bryobacteraceae bacterium]
MAMHRGGNQPAATINVTPLIDVLLVLLIIFMVIVPAHSVGLPVRAPQVEGNASPTPADRRALVITVLGDGGAVLNRERMAAADWPERLRWILARRADKTVFFTTESDMEFRVVGRAIDQARGAGASQVGLLAKPD